MLNLNIYFLSVGKRFHFSVNFTKSYLYQLFYRTPPGECCYTDRFVPMFLKKYPHQKKSQISLYKPITNSSENVLVTVKKLRSNYLQLLHVKNYSEKPYQISENIIYFYDDLTKRGPYCYSKRTQLQVFPSEFCEIFQN